MHSSKVESFAVPSDSSYDNKDLIIGLDNKRKTTSRDKEYDKMLERTGQEKDLKIRQELKKGSIVEIIKDALIDY